MSNVANFPRSGPVQPFTPFSPAKWEGSKPPPYDWMVDGCFLRSTVAMLSGDGGLGKSLLVQQLCTAASIGKPWLGLETQQVKTFAVFCEDDEDELHRRQEDICRHYDCSPGDLENIHYLSRVGMENVLMEFDRRTDQPRPTPLFDQLSTWCKESGAQIVALDTVADVFAGNEIIRNQVRRFISALRRLAVDCQASVILTAHPSVAGMATGTGNSGSTAWNNSVRSRLYLTRTKRPNDDGEEEEPNERFLRTMKNNQGPWGGKLRIKWEAGVFVRMDSAGIGQPSGMVDRIDFDTKLLDALYRLVENGSTVHAAHDFRGGFCNLVRTLPEFRAYSQGAILKAQDRLIAAGKAVRVEMGPPSKRRIYLRPVDVTYPGEMGE